MTDPHTLMHAIERKIADLTRELSESTIGSVTWNDAQDEFLSAVDDRENLSKMIAIYVTLDDDETEDNDG